MIVTFIIFEPIIKKIYKKYLLKNTQEERYKYEDEIKRKFSKYIPIEKVYLAEIPYICIIRNNIYIPYSYINVFKHNELKALIAREIYKKINIDYVKKSIFIFLGSVIAFILLIYSVNKNYISPVISFCIMFIILYVLFLLLNGLYEKYERIFKPKFKLINPFNVYYTHDKAYLIILLIKAYYENKKRKRNFLHICTLFDQEIYADTFSKVLAGPKSTLSALEKLSTIKNSLDSLFYPKYISFGLFLFNETIENIFDISLEKRIEKLKKS